MRGWVCACVTTMSERPVAPPGVRVPRFWCARTVLAGCTFWVLFTGGLTAVTTVCNTIFLSARSFSGETCPPDLVRTRQRPCRGQTAV